MARINFGKKNYCLPQVHTNAKIFLAYQYKQLFFAFPAGIQRIIGACKLKTLMKFEQKNITKILKRGQWDSNLQPLVYKINVLTVTLQWSSCQINKNSLNLNIQPWYSINMSFITVGPDL